MKRRSFLNKVGATLAGLFAGKALADLPCVGAVPEQTSGECWTHVVVSLHDGRRQVYVNGVKVLCVSPYPTLYTHALSPAQVASLYMDSYKMHRVPGHFGVALSFDGGDYVEVPESSLPLSDDFTISVWIPPVKGKETDVST